MKKQLLTLFILLCAGISAIAQSSSFSFQYSMGFGAGDMKDYTPNASFRGATLEWRNMYNPTSPLVLKQDGMFFIRHYRPIATQKEILR